MSSSSSLDEDWITDPSWTGRLFLACRYLCHPFISFSREGKLDYVRCFFRKHVLTRTCYVYPNYETILTYFFSFKQTGVLLLAFLFIVLFCLRQQAIHLSVYFCFPPFPLLRCHEFSAIRCYTATSSITDKVFFPLFCRHWKKGEHPLKIRTVETLMHGTSTFSHGIIVLDHGDHVLSIAFSSMTIANDGLRHYKE